jgi:hypothetical protein
MVAYLTKQKKGFFTLRICQSSCNGLAYQNAIVVQTKTKKEARAYCAAHAIQPWNF